MQIRQKIVKCTNIPYQQNPIHNLQHSFYTLKINEYPNTFFGTQTNLKQSINHKPLILHPIQLIKYFLRHIWKKWIEMFEKIQRSAYPQINLKSFQYQTGAIFTQNIIKNDYA